MNKLKMRSKDNITDNIEKIQELFPNAITEYEDGVKIDFDILKQELSNDIVEGSKERYQLTWPGKKEAILTANTPTTKTLRPIKEKSLDFNGTENIYIEGDNLEVLKILQQSYLGKVKCIYIDPPYNTGKDFIYKDNFNNSKEQELIESGQIDESGNKFIQNSDSNGRYHSDWLSMMYSRMKLSKNLLKKNGVVYISIDDNEVHNLREICNEIFGAKNFICQIVWTNKEGGGSSDSNHFRVKHEYILCYAKSKEDLKIYGQPVDDIDRYKLSDDYEVTRGKYQLIKLNSSSIQYSSSLDYGIEAPDGEIIFPGDKNNRACWRWSKEKLQWGIVNEFVVIKKNINDEWSVYTKQYLNCDNNGNIKERTIQPMSIIDKFSTTQSNKSLKNLMNEAVFNYSKPVELLKYLFGISTNEGDLIVDFFSGSATSAHAIMDLNSEKNIKIKYIMVQLQEEIKEKDKAFDFCIKNNLPLNICSIGQERIRRAAQKIKVEYKANIDYGFRVFKVDSSNMKEVYYRPNEFRQDNLSLFENNIKEDRSDEDLLTQVILDLGLTLDLKIEERTINNHKVYFVANNSLVACFSENIKFDVIEKLCEFKPLKLVLRDSSFESDQDKINVLEKVKILTSNTEVSVI